MVRFPCFVLNALFVPLRRPVFSEAQVCNRVYHRGFLRTYQDASHGLFGDFCSAL
jgi:hypothetical protein